MRLPGFWQSQPPLYALTINPVDRHLVSHLTRCVRWKLFIRQRHPAAVDSRERYWRLSRWEKARCRTCCSGAAVRRRRWAAFCLDGRCGPLRTSVLGCWSCTLVEMRVQQKESDRMAAGWARREAGALSGFAFPLSVPLHSDSQHATSAKPSTARQLLACCAVVLSSTLAFSGFEHLMIRVRCLLKRERIQAFLYWAGQCVETTAAAECSLNSIAARMYAGGCACCCALHGSTGTSSSGRAIKKTDLATSGNHFTRAPCISVCWR